MFLDNIKISNKIMGLSFGVLLIVSLGFGYVAISSIERQGAKAQEGFSSYSSQDIERFRGYLMESYKVELKQLTDVAFSLMEDLNRRALAGEISLEEAQEMAKRQIGAMRYDGDKGYFWINSDDRNNPIMIMHPVNEALIGQDVGRLEKDGVVVTADSTNTPMFAQMARVCRASPDGMGYVGYQWPSPVNQSEWLPKLSFVKRFESWGWIVGTGVYIDDIDRAIAVKEDESQEMLAAFSEEASQQTASAVTRMIIVLLVLAGVAVSLILLVSKNITKPLKKLQLAANAISKGDLRQDTDFSRRDEIGDIGEAFSELIENQRIKADVAEKIADGDLEVEVTLGSDEDTLGHSMKRMVASLNAMKTEVLTIVERAQSGVLSYRADVSRQKGAYTEFLNGLNDVLVAVEAPLDDVSAVLESAAQRDLTGRVEGDYQGQFAEFKDNVNNTIETLEEALSGVADATDQVASASNQIAASSQSVAQGTSEQASSLEETSSSLEEMSGMTKQNADNTQQARVLAQSTKDSADKGSESMAQMIESMGQIRTSAEGTAAIIKDINEIAFQTNLLALNAAVEAARAGDAGRGFAVVAEEVRNLALRSKEAATKTEALIRESVSLAEHGGQISNDVNSNLTEIVEAVSKVTNIVTEIAAASTEQARGIEQVNDAMSQMDAVVQQAAANAEESSSAAEELSSQAQELAATVGGFRLSRRGQEKENVVGSIGVRSSKQTSNAGTAARSPKPEDVIPLDEEDDAVALASF